MQTGYSDNVKPGAGVENNNVQPEQELNSDIQPIDTTSSPVCTNANVVCSQMSGNHLIKTELPHLIALTKPSSYWHKKVIYIQPSVELFNSNVVSPICLVELLQILCQN